METMQPNDVQAEQAVLGAILIDNTSLDRLTLRHKISMTLVTVTYSRP